MKRKGIQMKNLLFILLLLTTAMAQGEIIVERDFEMALYGDLDAQYNLGVRYENGLGVIQDYKNAATWYRLAAEQGHANAQYNLGAMYTNGQGVLQDYKVDSSFSRSVLITFFLFNIKFHQYSQVENS